MASRSILSSLFVLLQLIAIAATGVSTAQAQALPGTAAVEKVPGKALSEPMESELWNAIRDSDDPRVFEEYLRQYPGGLHAEQAASRLAGLGKAARQPAAGVAAAPDPETAMWKVVFQSDSSGGYEVFLRHYPKGKYASIAARRLKLARENDKWKAESVEEGAWQTAESARTAEAYAAYLDRYPQGRYAALARTQAERLGAGAAAAEENRLWLAAEKGGMAQANDYLRSYPNGRHASAVTTRREQLMKEEADMAPGRIVKDCPDCPEMVVLPAGSFPMGALDAKPAHVVGIKRPFAMAKTEVTQRQWRAIMGTAPSRHARCDDCPVEGISWHDAQQYVEKLSRLSGKVYRLPSEAEWEYACRAGDRHEYCGGNDPGSVAWLGASIGSGNSDGTTHPAGQKQANAFGLHDMSGNVAEWVEDCYHVRYQDGPIDGSAWTIGEADSEKQRGINSGAKTKGKDSGAKTRSIDSNPGSPSSQKIKQKSGSMNIPRAQDDGRQSGECRERVLRGGSWLSWPQHARAADRVPVSPGSRTASYGIRPVWSLR